MGSKSDNGIDATVGGLVWVRRRNGSWWPGQIIELDEDSENFMASPKSGTPIKLLGRDDASVDWYNLEKSKRVKPFRCGDYDVCINKAKLAAANSARKAVKYARREDAILHALDIEMEKASGEIVRPPESDHMDNELSGFNDRNSSVQDLIEDPNQARLRRTPNDSEDDGPEGVKRMRGLDDIGMGAVPTMKRNKTQAHELMKRKDRRRPLSKVLESTAMVSVPVVCEKFTCRSDFESVVINSSDSVGVSCENRILRKEFGHGFESVLVSCKQKENKISRLLGIPGKDSSLEQIDVPLVPKRMQSAGTRPNVSSQKPQIGVRGQSGHFSRVETLSLGYEELNESVSTSSGTADIDKSNSKWQSKGKRNSRNTVRSKKNINNNFNDNLDEYWGWSSRRSAEVALPREPKILPYRHSRSMMNPKYGPEFSTMNHDESVIELYDVRLEVKASSRPQHVPYISLRSKLTGQPVIGHPLTVEVLEEGSTDMYASSSEIISPKHLKSHIISPVKSTKVRKSATSSKKIRKLSSLTGFSRLREGERSLVAEKIMGAVMACVPLNVVFSRMNAALRGLRRPSKRILKSQDR